MDIQLFYKMFNDKYSSNYSKLKYKYPDDFEDYLKSLGEFYYKKINLLDFQGNNLVFFNNIDIDQNIIKTLLEVEDDKYSKSFLEEEIISSSRIENIELKKESVRRIIYGYAPDNEEENIIYGLKKGFDFISDLSNKITEENIYKLYTKAIFPFLSAENKLINNNLYRHDVVYLVSNHNEHTGLDFQKLPEYMSNLIKFVNEKDEINDLIKASIIHFYIGYIHPYFDGNGRMARLLHLWFLIQKGYTSTLFLSFSSLIEKERKLYYDAFEQIEKNYRLSKVIDVTPFINYFNTNIYNRMLNSVNNADISEVYNKALKDNQITIKETKLWGFVKSNYGYNEFSTKQLEKDYKDVAYATIYNFVLKFEKLGLLVSKKYSTRIRYKIKKY